jgi:LysR family transcriptional regulator for metE and metH
LLKTAQHVIAQIEDAELEIAKIVSGDRGELKVGTQCIFCYKWLPRIIREFQLKYPNIEFEIGNSSDLDEELQTKQYDFIITAATAATAKNEYYHYVPLFEDQIICIMPSDHPLTAHKWIDFKDFNHVNLISPTEKGRSRFYQSFLKPACIEPKRFMVVGQPRAMIDLVASGFGISVFPRWAVKGGLDSDSVAARPITKDGLPVTWYAAFLEDRQIPIFQKKFVNLVSKMNIE